jgi:hypothetical protein
MRTERCHNGRSSSSHSPSAMGGVLQALEVAGCAPHPSGARWKARCPAHDDRTPSLSIATGKDGRVLLRCWAGCDTLAVLRALGLDWSDLFERRS